MREIAGLFDIADRDIAASRTAGLHTDWRFNIPYNAALQLATTALAVAGYQADRLNHHYYVIHSLEFTIGADSRTVRKFDLFRKKRNISDYERASSISELEAAPMTDLAMQLRRAVAKWIKSQHPK